MGFGPRQVLLGTAAKVAARFGIGCPPDAQLDPPPPAVALPEVAHTDTAAPPNGGPAAGDLFANLVEIADAQVRRFPEHNRPFELVALLADKTAEVARQVNHAEGTGAENVQDAPYDPENLAAEIAFPLPCARLPGDAVWRATRQFAYMNCQLQQIDGIESLVSRGQVT